MFNDNRMRKPRDKDKNKNRVRLPFRKKVCRFCRDKIQDFDYKDLKTLERFVTDRGKVVSSRISGNCVRHQRKLVSAIKKARFIAILPYVNK